MKSRYIILLVTLTVACGPKKQVHMPLPELTVAEAQECLVPNIVEFVSQTDPVRSYIIQPRVNGYLTSAYFDTGKPVRRGQLLYKIDEAPFRTQVVQARATLASARANMVEASANYDRSVPLARINAISQSQMDAATATLAAAREQVESSEALLENAMINLSYCTITAPERGVIAPSKANIGDYVGAGTQYEILTTISLDDSVGVNLSLPTVEYYKIVEHDRAAFRDDSLLRDIVLKLSDGSIYPEKGIYSYTEPLVDNRSGSIVFNVKFPNRDGLLKGGQFARVTAWVGQSKLRVLIPSRAVMEIQGEYGAYVVGKDDMLEFRKIEVGETVGDQWIVLSGVKSGERVITDGLLKAKSGMKIKVKS